MPKHKFAVGDRVIAIARTPHENIRSGVYTIVRILPLAEHGYQYRAKNALDTHERVLDEGSLRLAS